MKILLITGDDYAACEFESTYNSKEFVEVNNMSVGQTINIPMEEREDIYATLLEFGTVDREFIEFIKEDIQDYDDSKTVNFYVIEE
jgi:hypothetical protein